MWPCQSCSPRPFQGHRAGAGGQRGLQCRSGEVPADGFFLQDMVAAGVGEAGEKRDEPSAGEPVSPTAWHVAAWGLARESLSQSTGAARVRRGLGLGMCWPVVVDESLTCDSGHPTPWLTSR